MFLFGVLQFSSKCRIGTSSKKEGLMFKPLSFSQLTSYPFPLVVSYKIKNGSDRRVADVWAKVKTSVTEKDGSRLAELIEIFGDVGDPIIEARILRYHFEILPCRYPPVLVRLEREHLIDATITDNSAASYSSMTRSYVTAVTVDGEYTRDRDDAMSLVVLHRGDTVETARLGIHIVDVAALLCEMYKDDPTALEIAMEWAQKRGATAYWREDCGDGSGHAQTSSPVFPNRLCHDVFSLQADGRVRPCISLYYEIARNIGDGDGGESNEDRTWHILDNVSPMTVLDDYIRIDLNTTYSSFEKERPYMVRVLRELLSRDKNVNVEVNGGENCNEGLVEWAMLRYNLHFARMFQNRECALLRVQKSSEEPASYAMGSAKYVGHASMPSHAVYGHFTSPIRRFADLYNQMCLFPSRQRTPDGAYFARLRFASSPLTSLQVDGLNSRMDALRQYHAREAVMRLAYRCMSAPLMVDAVAIPSEDGRALMLTFPSDEVVPKRLRVPFHDSYFAEDVCAIYREGINAFSRRRRVTLHGVIPRHRAELRIRIVDN
jgi:hypothetical protein